MKNNNVILGTLLVIVGVLFLVDQTLYARFFRMENMWPVFVLLPGLALELNYFLGGKSPALLVPGGILTIMGLLFFFETLKNTSINISAILMPSGSRPAGSLPRRTRSSRPSPKGLKLKKQNFIFC